MTEFRSDAEKFVSTFLDYIYKHDILDFFNTRTQKMERSVGIDKLIKQAQAVFPARAADGQKENEKVGDVDAAIAASPNVVDTREMFSRKVQASGGVRSMLRALYRGEEGASEAVREFFAAEDGEKEFAKDK